MRPEIAAAKAEADKAWEEIVWPSMCAVGFWGPDPQCEGADVSETGLGRMLDMLCGVDKVIKPNGFALLYGLRMHFVTSRQGTSRSEIGYTRPWLTVRYKTKHCNPTEFDKLPHVSGRMFQAYVSMRRRIVTRAYDVPAQAVLEALRRHPLDLQEVAGKNWMARCHLEWLEGADLRIYNSLDECHHVNRPTVDRLVARYGAKGRERYISAGHFDPTPRSLHDA